MDDLQDYEVDDILEYVHFLDRPEWERTRLGMYTNVQINTKKKLEPSDIISFPWEKDYSPTNTDISNSDVSRLTDKANALSKIIKNNGK